MKGLLLVILVIAFNGNYFENLVFYSSLFSLDAAILPRNQQRPLTLRGRVLFPTGSNIPIEKDGILTVELQDVSLADAPAKVIAKSIGQAIEFPMAFAIKYQPGDFVDGMRYSLQATIRNKKNDLLYINDVHVGVTPVGVQRTTNIDVPVIFVNSE
jgi:putative lipoprotein